ncbi:IS30 family transposase [Catenulispora sp. EB89]
MVRRVGRVGVNPRTGREWRNGRSDPRRAVRADLLQGAVHSGRFLDEVERLTIAGLLDAGASVRSIAAELGRAASTVSREFRRDRHPTSGQYRPRSARTRAESRRPRPKPRKIDVFPELRAFVVAGLARKWSQEQICEALCMEFPDRPELHLAIETVYQALYVQGRGELRRELAEALRTGRIRRRPRRQVGTRQPRFTDPMVMICDRPAEVEDRAVPGHRESDLIIGKGQKSQIGTLVERSTRYVMLVHPPADRTAETMRAALTATVQTLPAHLVRSLTWDQGAELGGHKAYTIDTGVPVYFCDPGKPWQRASN